MVAPLPLRRMSFATEAQRAEDYENRGSVNKSRKEMNIERQKSEKEGKTLPFISLGRIKSRPSGSCLVPINGWGLKDKIDG